MPAGLGAQTLTHYVIDVSERAWQKADLQWFRAKGSDTFGPMGPSLVRGAAQPT